MPERPGEAARGCILPASSSPTLFAMEIFNSTGLSVGLKKKTCPLLLPALEMAFSHPSTRDLCAILADISEEPGLARQFCSLESRA